MPKENMGDDLLNEKDNPEETTDDISWDDVSEEKQEAEAKATAKKAGETKPVESKKIAEFSELKESEVVSAPGNLDFIMDIPLEVTVELGRSSMPIYELLQLGQGSIIELDKMAGEPLSILVNQKLIARGEVVVVNEKFGIRLTEVVSTMERVEKLG